MSLHSRNLEGYWKVHQKLHGHKTIPWLYKVPFEGNRTIRQNQLPDPHTG